MATLLRLRYLLRPGRALASLEVPSAEGAEPPAIRVGPVHTAAAHWALSSVLLLEDRTAVHFLRHFALCELY